eukprot:975643_1
MNKHEFKVIKTCNFKLTVIMSLHTVPKLYVCFKCQAVGDHWIMQCHGNKPQTLNTSTDDAPETMLTCWCIGQNESGQFGIGNKNAQKQLMKCGWSEKIQIRNIYAANQYTLVEDIHGNYYSAGWNGSGACTVNDKSKYILNMTPITYFK